MGDDERIVWLKEVPCASAADDDDDAEWHALLLV